MLTGSFALLISLVFELHPKTLETFLPTITKILPKITLAQVIAYTPQFTHIIHCIFALSIFNLTLLFPLALAPTASRMKTISAFLMGIGTLGIGAYQLLNSFLTLIDTETQSIFIFIGWTLYTILPVYGLSVIIALSIIIYTLYRRSYHSPLDAIRSHIEE